MPTQYQVQDYVALSYTWGKIDPLTLNEENMDELAEEGALDRSESRLPETIRDAIRLCGMIQQRYLWVDSLCIVQDTRDKHDQIRQMDRIYRHAVLTVIAAAGGDGNAGLPGVSNARQTKQKIINMKGMTLANVLPHLEHSLAHSVWQGRGWT
ncbi:heterokaryon incompatibility, partial [Lophiotrema nucula]